MRPYHPIHPNYERFKHLRGSIILVEGIIGAGKSTLGRRLTSMLNEIGISARHYDEEVNMPLLELFLSDMKKYAFAFQMYMLQHRQAVYRDAITYCERHNGVAIVDRSLFGDIAFARMHHTGSNISDDEWKVYESTISSNSLRVPSAILYLDVTPDVAMRRIKARNRGSEASEYDVQYLQALHDNYIKAMDHEYYQVLHIDWNQDSDLGEETLVNLLDLINPK